MATCASDDEAAMPLPQVSFAEAKTNEALDQKG